MVFISHLKLRNFKSFKAADISLPRTFICFAGPNGSGKSNLCDAIRFAMGETSLRSLRAKRVKDLIHHDARSAEVTLAFEYDGGKKYEIKRAIREDGKILYRLNGDRTTRSAILEALKKYNLDGSGRNTIAQGEVQRIIAMNGKDRRMIIDSVAGIADFEEKKKEALRELETVETRIKDANLVLGERKAFLDELGREKDTAIKYTDAKKTFTNSRATLLKLELEKQSKDLGDAAAQEEKLLFVKGRKEQDLADIQAKVNEVDSRRMAVSQELQNKQKTNTLIRRIEELKASCGSKTQLIEDKEGFVKRMGAEREALAKEITHASGDMEKLRKEMESLRSDFKVAESKFSAQGGITEDEAVAKARKAVEDHELSLASARELLIAISAEIDSKREITEAKKAEAESIVPGGAGPKESAEGRAETEIEKLRREVQKIAAEIDRSFARTKEINSQVADLDRQLLELKEKHSIFRVRTSPQLANPALSFINDLKQKGGAHGIAGIHGTLADLISFDPKHAAAVEAAGGSRLLYVVVDDVDTATAVIERLKKARAGRATFIPLSSVRTPPRAKAGGFASVIEVVDFPEKIRTAAEYAFSETLLVDDVTDAKKLGVGTARMVTLEGEIFERSGIVSGGRSESGILGANTLRKIEEEMAQTKSAKDSLIQELYSIREDESRLRAEKSQLEIGMKTRELELRVSAEKMREREHLLKRHQQLLNEIKELESLVASKAAEKEKLAATIAAKEETIKGLREKLRSAEESFRKQTEASSQKRADLSAAVSSLKATIEGKGSELELRKKELSVKEERLKDLDKERKAGVETITQIKRQLEGERVELGQLEEKITATSREIEKLYEQMKAHGEEFAALGKQLGQARLDLDRIAKDLNQLSIRRATASTRVEDLKIEFAKYDGAQFLDLKKDELNRLAAESERILAELGNVNLAAIEMYGRKKAEIEDAQQKIEKLGVEREAILSMIGEIEEHKKEAFFETFQAVSDNFSKMFKHIQIGQGYLYLDKPADPFESGLFIKLRRNNKDYSLDGLSGGENTLVALMFIFALQFFKPAPFYVLDEVDAALDKANSKNLAELVSHMARDSQFILVSHNDTIMAGSDSVIGVAKVANLSKLVGVKLKQAIAT